MIIHVISYSITGEAAWDCDKSKDILEKKIKEITEDTNKLKERFEELKKENNELRRKLTEARRYGTRKFHKLSEKKIPNLEGYKWLTRSNNCQQTLDDLVSKYFKLKTNNDAKKYDVNKLERANKEIESKIEKVILRKKKASKLLTKKKKVKRR